MPVSMDHPGRSRKALRRVLAIALLAAPFAVLAASSAPRQDPVPGYPHGKFKADCVLCHGANSWKPAKISKKFDHGKYGFALQGAHAATDCQTCHTSLEFSVQKTRCASCHEDAHLGELGQDCARCHTARSFIDRSGMIRGHQMTRFALTGSHTAVDCEMCHKPVAAGHMQFVNTQAECSACHIAEYQATTNPDHAAGDFPTDCMVCHSTMSWQGGRFVHPPVTAACNTCHMPDYQATTTPNHAQSGFSTDCAMCHNTRSWLGAQFSHANITETCNTCHMPDYQATTNPNHAQSGFSTDCATCHHSTTTWFGAQFDHDQFFPINSGAHRDKWNACTDCHTSPGNYSVFTCLSCHPHSDANKTNGDHSGVNGYQYESAACLTCHPRGRH